MTGLKELYEDALEWLSFEQASDNIHWYARRVVKAFEKEAQIRRVRGREPPCNAAKSLDLTRDREQS